MAEMWWEKGPSSPNSLAVGMTIQQVEVREMVEDQNLARCLDDFGYEVRVKIYPLRAPRMPLVGEKWIIDRKFGPWSFVAPLNNYKPTVEGSLGDLSAVVPSLLAALTELGLIHDNTTEAPS